MAYEKKPDILIARRGYSDTGGVSDFVGAIGSAIKSVGTGALNVFAGKSKSEGEAEAYAEIAKQQAAANAGGTPAWVMPAAAVGAGVLLIVLLKRRKK